MVGRRHRDRAGRISEPELESVERVLDIVEDGRFESEILPELADFGPAASVRDV
jgi:hypothetical protein